ncbi:expressed protein [Phakopsora pachyrhizi]|uniref:Expressed protein n=1 Tax=Phakopsora pachyrhizi TaxID=170000 RepID=A0AAV0AYP0_PHAPC|nr:expressed protein [Phakopsora pachyrhizi]
MASLFFYNLSTNLSKFSFLFFLHSDLPKNYLYSQIQLPSIIWPTDLSRHRLALGVELPGISESSFRDENRPHIFYSREALLALNPIVQSNQTSNNHHHYDAVSRSLGKDYKGRIENLNHCNSKLFNTSGRNLELIKPNVGGVGSVGNAGGKATSHNGATNMDSVLRQLQISA